MPTEKRLQQIYAMPFAAVYPHYVTKVEKKGRSLQELHAVIGWLTGYGEKQLLAMLKDGTDFKAFFTDAPRLNPHRSLVTGIICGERVEEIEDPMWQNVRYLDKLVDELARGKQMESILRTPKAKA